MAVCMALMSASATGDFGANKVSILLFNDYSLTATSPLLSDKKRYPYYLRVSSSDALTLFSKYGIKRIAGIGNNDSYGQGGLGKLVTYAARATPPIEVVATVFYSPTISAPSDLNSSTCLPVLEVARTMRILEKPRAWLMGNGIITYSTRDKIAGDFPELAKVITNNTLILGFTNAITSSSVREQFDADYAKYLGTSQAKSMYTYFEYDATLALIYAMKQMIATGQDPHNRSLLYSTLVSLDYEGTTGKISFDESGDRFATINIYSWVPGSDNLQEVTIMKSIRHPNLLLFMCYAKSDTGLTIISEFMPNGSLYDLLSDKTIPLAMATKLTILSDIASGMAYLHGGNPPIIHCDLKSSNVLHGSATTHDDDYALGSILWSAPEIITNGAFSTKSDVYAFGVIIWETVTRDLPYEDMNPVLVASHVVDNMRPKVGPEFESVQPLRKMMEQCWHQDPASRPDFACLLPIIKQMQDHLGDHIVLLYSALRGTDNPTGRLQRMK
eukprot:m51a1_g12438 putative pas domain-containing protein tyrosine kinase (500) ;mRNA; f:836029-838601